MSDTEKVEKKVENKIKKNFSRAVVEVVSGICVEGVVAAAIVSLVPAESRAQRIKRAIGAHVIASMVAEKGAGWSGRSFQDLKDAVRRGKEQAAKAMAEMEEEVDD